MEGMKGLIIGLGRAGCGMAIALKRVGADVSVVDEKSADNRKILSAMDEMATIGVPVTTCWTGDVNWKELDFIAVSPGVPMHHPVLQEAVLRNTPIYSEPEIAYRITNSPIIAITGTNGKSTVTALTYFLLKNCGKESILCGNIAGSGFPEVTVCEASVQANPDTVLIAEISSFQLEWISQFKPKGAAITSIFEDHLDRYQNIETYIAMKRKIFMNMDEKCFAVVNKLAANTSKGIPEPVTTFFINSENADAVIKEDVLSFRNINKKINISELWSPTKFNLQNTATACLLAHGCGIPLENLIEKVIGFPGLANRMERIDSSIGIEFINNSMCTNPSALSASLSSFKKPVLLLAGGINKIKNWEEVSKVSKSIKKAFVFGKDRAWLKRFFYENKVDVEQFASLSEAFQNALSSAQKGDTILLSPGCASFDQFESFVERGNEFRKMVQEVIEYV